MLTFEEKIQLIEKNFPELTRHDVSLGRVNYQFEESMTDKKNVVYHLHPNGNGFVYAGELAEYPADSKGMVNIREFSSEELSSVIRKSIASLTEPDEQEEEEIAEKWINDEGQVLMLVTEGELWNVYAGVQLDGTFTTYGEAVEYLDQEGFTPSI
ncbi:hypothetical protein [Thalassobacillus sp. C254]|uniref:hypothetical protein n=1 Tax=Thalassobacillus sp. C254 TaxID=1225341 RepID=UPI0006D1F0C6|nr:hypothetical protein [Thalassobacillus sp. C254]